MRKEYWAGGSDKESGNMAGMPIPRKFFARSRLLHVLMAVTQPIFIR